WTRSRSAALGLESIHPFVARPLHPLVPGLSRHPEPFAVPDERRLATRREPGLHELLPEQPRERLLGHPPNVDDRCAQTPRNQSVAARQIATLPAPRVSPRLPVRRVQKVPGLYRYRASMARPRKTHEQLELRVVGRRKRRVRR